MFKKDGVVKIKQRKMNIFGHYTVYKWSKMNIIVIRKKGGHEMRAIMMMFDTLTRNYLPDYGCNFTKMPNFERLAERAVTFDEFYGGSMPCMPARRELHTGKYNFLNRGWGPLEPFDESFVEILSKNGIYTHLVTRSEEHTSELQSH